MRRTVPHLVPVLLALAAGPASAQVPARDYYRHLPPMPRLVAQTGASARLHLYGDTAAPTYRDVSPRDGVDDVRGDHLRRIALRFSPILRRNNFSRPRFFPAVFGGRPVLHIDTWHRGERVRSDSVLLYEPPDEAALDWTAASEHARSDSLLRALVREHHPEGRSTRVVAAEGEFETVAFFDFPGEDQRTWRTAYRDARDTGIYAHFFIHEDGTVRDDARFALVVQYWFFYPFNDGGNNHEGDWEHLAVLLTTRARAAAGTARLDEADLRGVLDGTVPLDQVVIREVEYYFHESVVVLPYFEDPAPPRSRVQELLHLHVWEQDDFSENTVRERLSYLDGRLASHPIGYIGGNNKGPDELTHAWPRFQGSYNRNSHGTFPFSGTWQGVGPVGATEQLSGTTVPRLRRGAEVGDGTPLDQLFEDDHFIAFEASEIVLLPDWERVAGLVLRHPQAMREWSWLLLPVRWGFPASASPGAGAIAHVDLGQVAPEGPAFQPTWNRLAAESGFHLYQPRVLRALFSPATPWDRLSSGWGFLNIPKTLLGFVPGWSVLLAQLGPWLTVPLEAVGAPPPKVFAPQRPPRRLSSFGIGWHYQFGGSAFAQLLPQPEEASVAGAFARTPASYVDPASLVRHDAFGLRASLSLHYGPRFTVQNTLARSTSRLAYAVLDADADPIGELEGALDMTEVTGGFRYRLIEGFGGMAELSAGAGWGWTWYDLRQVRSDDRTLDFERRGGYPVSLLPSARWWPNTWYATVGVELLAPRRRWLAQRVGYGLLLEYTGLIHRLGDTTPGEGGSLGGVTRKEVAAGLVVSW